jgi:hypothetical protein
MVGFAQEETRDRPLGPIGGTYRITASKGYIRVTSATAGAPGAIAGLQTNDVIYGVFGKPFTPTGSWHYGVTQELGFAIDRAESGNGMLPLSVLRPGFGAMSLSVNLPVAGAYGPAYPLGSTKFATTYEAACSHLHTRLNVSGNIGYPTSWAALALLGHPNWNDTTGAKPYRLSLNKVRDYAVAQITAAIYAPVEDKLIDGTANPNYAGGTSNWDLGGWVMFLSEYSAKSGDRSVDAAIQRGAEICANSIQWWKQPALNANGYSPEMSQIAGMVSHGGVTGDYMHLGWGGGINMCGVHSFNGLAFAKSAGANMTIRPRDGHYFGYATAPTGVVPAGMEDYNHSLAEKFTMCSDWMLGPTGSFNGGEYDGHVCYTRQGSSAYDAGGRTPAALLGLMMHQRAGGTLTATELDKAERMKGYITRRYMQHQEAHAFCVGAQVFQQLVSPFLSDRQQRYFMENWRFFYALGRDHTGAPLYVPSRSVNDSYLNYADCAAINAALPLTVATGGLPHVPAYNSTRILASFQSPDVTWPKLEARSLKTSSATVAMPVQITDSNGAPLTPTSAVWTKLSGPGNVTFSAPNSPTTNMTFSQSGNYQVQLVATSGLSSITEPVEVQVQLTTPPDGYTMGQIQYDVYPGITGTSVASLTSAASYPNSPASTSTLLKFEGTYSGDNYGARVSGLIFPPITGSYIFYIASDDASQLKLNTSGTSAAGATVIASVSGYTGQYEWNKNASQRSVALNLTAGIPLYIEALHKEGGGADHLAVGWSINGGAIEVIDGVYLAARSTPQPAAIRISQHPVPASSAMGGNVTFSVTASGPEPMLYQWRRNGMNIGAPGAEPTLALTNVSGGADGDYDVVITSPVGTLVSNSAHLTVTDVGATVAGGLWREVYNNVSGGTIASLAADASFPYFADASGVITSGAAPSGVGENYGQRWTGWLKPTVSGNYRFYLTADDSAELWLSVDDTRAHRVKITSLTSYSGDKSWGSVTPSAYIPLVAGQRYYIEVLHAEGSGGDHVAVAWQRQGDAAPVNGTGEIPGTVLEYRTGGYYADPVPTPPYPLADLISAEATVATVFDVLANDLDLDNATLTVQSVTQGALGRVSFSGRNVIYTSQPGLLGEDTFTYVTRNSQGLIAAGSVRVTITDSASGLLGWWRMNEANGNSVTDSSGSQHSANFTGAPTWTAGKFGGGLQFNGTSDYLTTVNSITTPSPLTITAWINPNTTSGVRTILAQNGAASFRTNGTGLRFTTPGIRDHNTATGLISANVWQHVAVTFQPNLAGGVRFYVNGTLRATINSSGQSTNGNAWWIGRAQGGEYFSGALDEVRLYNRALTASEIAIIAGATHFDDWRANHFTPTQLGNSLISGANAINNGANLTNLAAFAFNKDPFSPASGALAWPAQTGGTNFFEYRRRKAPTGLTFVEKTSTDLIIWTAGALTPISVTDDGNGLTETVRVQPSSGIPKLFFRVEVSQ